MSRVSDQSACTEKNDGYLVSFQPLSRLLVCLLAAAAASLPSFSCVQPTHLARLPLFLPDNAAAAAAAHDQFTQNGRE